MNLLEGQSLTDAFDRQINYVRLSVTDRCDFRCVYCMAENMQFIPRQQILTLEEIAMVARAFTELGVTKIRLTGGEPLVRKNILSLFHSLSELTGLEELLLTTNGSRLASYANQLKAANVKRINVSLDSLHPDKFRQFTRNGNLHNVIQGIDAACNLGFERIKINAVVLKDRNDDEIVDLVDFARQRHIDISFIEEMPLGNIEEHDRANSFISNNDIRTTIAEHYPLEKCTLDTGGPARYYQMADSSSRIGFISPHTHNFCDTCNRVRLTVDGRLLLCLGNEDSVDLRAILRRYPGEITPLKNAIIKAVLNKPERHYFDVNDDPQVVRFMNMTGG